MITRPVANQRISCDFIRVGINFRVPFCLHFYFYNDLIKFTQALCTCYRSFITYYVVSVLTLQLNNFQNLQKSQMSFILICKRKVLPCRDNSKLLKISWKLICINWNKSELNCQSESKQIQILKFWLKIWFRLIRFWIGSDSLRLKILFLIHSHWLELRWINFQLIYNKRDLKLFKEWLRLVRNEFLSEIFARAEVRIMCSILRTQSASDHQNVKY